MSVRLEGGRWLRLINQHLSTAMRIFEGSLDPSDVFVRVAVLMAAGVPSAPTLPSAENGAPLHGERRAMALADRSLQLFWIIATDSPPRSPPAAAASGRSAGRVARLL